jgi:segregation and condensation protein A
VSEPPDFDPGVATYSVSLPSFEGPLDLLLHLCQKHELDILQIPISFVTEKYLEYLNMMTLVNLDVASEYLVMAATLAHIKSKMLLPQLPEGQEDEALLEEEDPREALIRRLLEYQKYKQAAAELAARGIAGTDIFPRGAPIEEAVTTGLAPLADVSLFALMDAFQRVLAKSKVKITHDIVTDRISINDRIHELVDLLRDRKRVRFEDLFEGVTTRAELVITFLALLEMSKLRMTRLYQSGPLADLYVEVAGETIDASDLPPPDTHELVEEGPAPPQKQAATAAEEPTAAPEAHAEGASDEAPEEAPIAAPTPEPETEAPAATDRTDPFAQSVASEAIEPDEDPLLNPEPFAEDVAPEAIEPGETNSTPEPQHEPQHEHEHEHEPFAEDVAPEAIEPDETNSTPEPQHEPLAESVAPAAIEPDETNSTPEPEHETFAEMLAPQASQPDEAPLTDAHAAPAPAPREDDEPKPPVTEELPPEPEVSRDAHETPEAAGETAADGEQDKT